MEIETVMAGRIRVKLYFVALCSFFNFLRIGMSGPVSREEFDSLRTGVQGIVSVSDFRILLN